MIGACGFARAPFTERAPSIPSFEWFLKPEVEEGPTIGRSLVYMINKAWLFVNSKLFFDISGLNRGGEGIIFYHIIINQ